MSATITPPIAYTGLTEMAAHAILNLRAAETGWPGSSKWTSLDELADLLRTVAPDRWRIEAGLRRLEQRGLVWSRRGGIGATAGREFRAVTSMAA
jgi:hypothetical protein